VELGVVVGFGSGVGFNSPPVAGSVLGAGLFVFSYVDGCDEVELIVEGDVTVVAALHEEQPDAGAS
jgi:hypothetical protein